MADIVLQNVQKFNEGNLLQPFIKSAAIFLFCFYRICQRSDFVNTFDSCGFFQINVSSILQLNTAKIFASGIFFTEDLQQFIL